jgi:hypothetical protein
MDLGHGAEIRIDSMYRDLEVPVRCPQLRGPASTWLANFTTVQPKGHLVTWAEFKQAFREHYIPDGVLQMKLEDFVRLKQGGDSVMQYLTKFNHLSQYAIEQVDTDLKKKNCFMRGLNDRLQQRWPLAWTSLTAGP